MTFLIFIKWYFICSVAAAIIIVCMIAFDKWKYGDLMDPDEIKLD